MKSLTKFTTLLLCITCTTIFFSCSKDDNDNKTKTKTELLMAGPWKYTAVVSNPAYDWNGDGNSSTDILSLMHPCEKDDLENYKASGVFEINEGATKCDPTDPQTWTLTWELIDNETKIRFDGSFVLDLIEVTESVLKLKGSFVENGVTYVINETYSH